QRAAEAGAGIQVEPVRTQVRKSRLCGSMAVHDERTMAGVRRKKRLTYAKQISLGLLRERQSRSNACVYVQPVQIAELHRQCLDPGEVIGRKGARIIDTVAIESLFAAICPPIHEIPV